MNRLVFVFLLGCLGAKSGAVLTINNVDYSVQQFYAYFPKQQWNRADSTQRDKVFSDFVHRELSIMEARRLGLGRDPSLIVKKHNRLHQLLVNAFYERQVAFPLVSPDDIAEARMFARSELFMSHILIGYSGVNLRMSVKRTIDDALLLAQDIKNEFVHGKDFSVLANNYSDDPSVDKNSGVLGWVSWGATVPAFQSAAFRLDEGLLSDPVLTEFGYHLILVTDRRPSDYYYMSEEEYENIIINLSMGPVRGRLRAAAVAYDSLQIEEHGVYFNDRAISKIVHAYVLKQKGLALQAATDINVPDLLGSLFGEDVVCLYDKKGYGPKWFSNKIRRLPPSRTPALDSKNKIITLFKTIILQDIAVKKGFSLGVDSSFSFLVRKNNMISDLLYDAYLKYLVTNVSPPDTGDVWEYYNKNMSKKYMSPKTVLIREIRVASRRLADSLFFLIEAGADFSSLAQSYSLVNSVGGGLGSPFSRNQNVALFDAASLLVVGETSPVVSVPGGQFSIVFLEEVFDSRPLEFEGVYSSIESLLIKEKQDVAKKGGGAVLLEKYSVSSRLDLLQR